MRDLRDAVRALAGDFDRVAARFAGRSGQLRAVLVVVGETPACNAVAGGAERYGLAGVGIGVLAVEGHLIAHVGLCDRDGRGALHSLVVGLFEPEVDGVGSGIGERGLRRAVCAILGGGVGHGNVRRGDGQVNAVCLAVILAGVAGGGVRKLPRNDAVCVVNEGPVLEDAALAKAHHLDPVVARKGRRFGQFGIFINIVIQVLPSGDEVVSRREVHGLSGVRIARLLVEDHLVTDVNGAVFTQCGRGQQGQHQAQRQQKEGEYLSHGCSFLACSDGKGSRFIFAGVTPFSCLAGGWPARRRLPAP